MFLEEKKDVGLEHTHSVRSKGGEGGECLGSLTSLTENGLAGHPHSLPVTLSSGFSATQLDQPGQTDGSLAALLPCLPVCQWSL